MKSLLLSFGVVKKFYEDSSLRKSDEKKEEKKVSCKFLRICKFYYFIYFSLGLHGCVDLS